MFRNSYFYVDPYLEKLFGNVLQIFCENGWEMSGTRAGKKTSDGEDCCRTTLGSRDVNWSDSRRRRFTWDWLSNFLGFH